MHVAGAVVAASTFCLGLAAVPDITAQAVLGAAGAGLAQFGLIAFGVERARDKAWSPASVAEVMDADSVIAAAERDGTA